MKKLTLVLTALSLAAGSSLALAQPAAPNASSAVSSYSPPTQKHVKKAKKKKVKKGASAPAASAPAATPEAASQ
ncbi:acid-shock protein [Paraburkholderia flava]|uniref:acid-shock protein n=1 Tax=Paraburkholderia flava TaxID=2547393 RepID=UPI00105ECD94|nr:acid-shock protein [Paraburkholderia flava]